MTSAMRGSARRFAYFSRRLQRVEDDLELIADRETHDCCLRRPVRINRSLNGQLVLAQERDQLATLHAGLCTTRARVTKFRAMKNCVRSRRSRLACTSPSGARGGRGNLRAWRSTEGWR